MSHSSSSRGSNRWWIYIQKWRWWCHIREQTWRPGQAWDGEWCQSQKAGKAMIFDFWVEGHLWPLLWQRYGQMMYKMALLSLLGRWYLGKKSWIIDNTVFSQPHCSSLQWYQLPLEFNAEGLVLYMSNHHPNICFTIQINWWSSWLTESWITENQSLSWTTTTFALGHCKWTRID